MLTPRCTTVSPARVNSQLPPRSAAISTITDARLHGFRHFRCNQNGRFPARHGSRGDHDILLFQYRGEQFALAFVNASSIAFAYPPCTFGGFDIEHDELRAQALDLLLDGGAHIVSRNHRAQAASRSRSPADPRRPRPAPAPSRA